MAQFEPVKEEIEKAGGSVLYIAAEKRGGIFKPEKFLGEHPVSFPFLLDEDRKVTRAYGVYHRMGVDAYNIAHPASLVVDRGGVVRFIYVGANQHDRAPMESVLAAIKKT